MKTSFLLPHQLLKPGLILLPIFLALGLACLHFDFELAFLSINGSDGFIFDGNKQNLTNEIAGIGLIISLAFAGFSKLKHEDERSLLIRLESLLFAFYFNACLIVVGTLAFYGFGFIYALTYLIYLPFLVYLLRFWILIRRG